MLDVSHRSSYNVSMSRRSLECITFFKPIVDRRREVPAEALTEWMRRNQSSLHGRMRDLTRRRHGVRFSDRVLPWPEPKSDKEFVLCSDLNYSHLDGEAYDADVALCYVESLEDVDPVLGYLLYRRRAKFQHIGVITEKELPQEHSSNTYRGLLAVPLNSARQGNGFFEPYPEDDQVDGRYPFLRKNGILSFHAVEHLRGERLSQLIDVLYVGKYGI